MAIDVARQVTSDDVLERLVWMFVAELLFDVIATAYERTSVVLTTNLGFEHWTEVLGNERLTGAALDRLTHRCTIIETSGESYRLQDAKRRRKVAS